MQHDQFIGHVQDRANLDSRGSAEAATRAPRDVRRSARRGRPDNPAAQLPPEIGLHLCRRDHDGDPFDVGDPPPGRRAREPGDRRRRRRVPRQRAVLSVVRDAVSEGLLEHLASQLPAEYEAVFELAPAH